MNSVKIQLKTDTIANWTLNEDALLLNGEAAVVLFPDGSSKLKIGNGITAFKDLPYILNVECYGERLINVGEPEQSSDAATKNYVDNLLLNAGDKYILKTAMLEECSDGLSCKVDNYAITTISIDSPTTPISVILPEITNDNKVRDFVIRFENTGNENASIAFVPQNDEDIDYESDSDDWAIVEPGINLISFTETKR